MTAAAGLTVTDQADSYATLGFQLGTGQRDFRVHNDISDAASNNNQTPAPNWPRAGDGRCWLSQSSSGVEHRFRKAAVTSSNLVSGSNQDV